MDDFLLDNPLTRSSPPILLKVYVSIHFTAIIKSDVFLVSNQPLKSNN